MKNWTTSVGPTTKAIWTRAWAAQWFWVPLAAFAATRAAIAAVIYLSAVMLPDGPDIYHLRGTDNLLLDAFASRWDTGFYISIAEEGYVNEGVPFPSTAFWPLFPLLMRAVGSIVGDVALAGVLIANGALLLAMLLLYRMVDDEFGAVVAGRTVWYMLIFPASLFGSAVYTESLYLFCSIAALYLARRGAWESSGLLGAAAALTRLVGITLAPVLLAEWWCQRRAGGRPALIGAMTAGLVPLGTLAYMAYLQMRFGDPLAFVHAAATWAREPRSPLGLVADLLQPPPGGWIAGLAAARVPVSEWIDALALLLFLGLAVYLLLERRWPEGLLVGLGLLLPLSSGLLMSQRRYVWVLFPAFVLLARWGERPWFDRLVVAISLTLLGLFTALFANGYWVA